MAHRPDSEPTRKRILQTCVRLFLEQGYKKTTMSEIIQEGNVSSSSFQNLFGAKDGVLLELTEFMFSGQFQEARKATADLPAVFVYAVETAIQLTLTELNENLREIYIVAYSKPAISEYIVRQTALELQRLFSDYLPGLSYEDFYKLDIGSSGIMRSYMAVPCTEEFTLEEKLRCFLNLSLRAYNVPQEEMDKAIAFVEGLDIRALAVQTMQKLMKALQMRYDFTFVTDPTSQTRQTL